MGRNLLLLAASLLVALALAEGILRLAPPVSLLAKLPNRPHQNTILATDEFSTRVVTNARGLREARAIGPRRADVFRVAAVGDSFTWGWGADNDATYPARLEALLKARTGHAVEVVNVSRPGDNLAGYLALLRQHTLPLRPDVVVVGMLLGNDCPLDWPPQPLSEERVAETVAAYARPALDALPKGSYLSRFLTVNVIQPAREWLRASRAAHRSHAIAGDNPLSPEALARLIGTNPDKTARAARLERDGWIDRGRRWAVSPWLVVSAIEAPDFPRVGLFLDADTRPAMEAAWRVCEGLIERLRADTEAVGARFVLLVLPSAMQVDADAVRRRRELGFDIDERALGAREPNLRLAAFCARNKLVCVDALDAALAGAARGERLFYPLDGHMTPAGYALVADQVAKMVAPWIAASAKK
jgi:lysophospholipase L1-like esterase